MNYLSKFLKRFIKYKSIGNSSGQALLLVLLAMAVGLTVVISGISRSVTDVTVTSYDEESARAFSAAEAGIEEALLREDTTTITGSFGSDVTYEVEYPESNSKGYIKYPSFLKNGESATFWIVDHKDINTLACGTGWYSPYTCARPSLITACWKGSGSDKPAIEMTLFYDLNAENFNRATNPSLNDYSGVRVLRGAAAPDPGSNNFSQAGKQSGSPPLDNDCKKEGYDYSHTVNVPSEVTNKVGGLLMVKIRVLGNSSPAEVGMVAIGAGCEASTDCLPQQGTTIESTASVGDVTRKVSVLKGYTEVPDVFSGVLYSEGGISK